jgi:hypothetical protein
VNRPETQATARVSAAFANLLSAGRTDGCWIHITPETPDPGCRRKGQGPSTPKRGPHRASCPRHPHRSRPFMLARKIQSGTRARRVRRRCRLVYSKTGAMRRAVWLALVFSSSACEEA